tara:strand:- start:10629 stop:11633 length:1005 start_codon:yes stop_codon:yes gene_type:complete
MGCKCHKQKVSESIKLPADKTIVLQADTDEHKRGLVVTWKSDGGYDVAYWYDTPDNIVAAELKGDGKSFGDIKNVWLGYHPKLDERLKKGESGCCHKCGWSHVKGSAHKTPYRTGKNSCANRKSEAKLNKEKFTDPEDMRMNEQRPMPQDTPNEFAYTDFKKWVYKNRKAVKGVLLKALKDNRGDGTYLFLALTQVWLAWANKKAKQWSSVPKYKSPASVKFGRALAVMMKKDNLIITKSGNKLTTVKEATDVWKKFDAMQKLQGHGMDIEMDMKNILATIKQLHKNMEQEAEPEGGKIADKYGKQLDKYEKMYKQRKAELKKVFAKLDKLEQF